ncbi:MAG: hypothetical protein HN704_16435 [Bacteroidetes bacterium]|jgi:hypothetical protein|nr:hypothetical protein [Bacteroidota bacterium]MBT6686586.1 hypothetical protein [Bacteroidota bacterium]MBT7144257.1 hypothetical protein [Bacteroidota bacterium]MBT7493186.1 hypothetical protein [Bacteroidota bacterium]
MKKNMSKALIGQIVVFLLLSTNCSVIKKQASEEIPDNENSKTVAVKELILDQQFRMSYDEIDYKIKNARINDEILSISVAYKGGCGQHNFDVVFNGMYAKSLPVKAALYIKHEAINETCERDTSEEIKFDISKIQYPRDTTVIINIFSYSPQLRYDY